MVPTQLRNLRMYKGNRARKHARPSMPRGGRSLWNVPRTQHGQMKRSCSLWRKKETTGHRRSSSMLHRSFLSSSPSCARVVVSNVSSMTGTDVPDQCRIHRCCCCGCSLTTAKLSRSCWSPSRVEGDVILWVLSVRLLL